MNKRIVSCFITMIIMITIGYIISHYSYDNYEQRLTAGNKYFSQDRYKAAIGSYKIAVDIDPDNPQTYGALAHMYGKIREYTEKNNIYVLAKQKNIDKSTVLLIEKWYDNFNNYKAADIKMIDDNTVIYYDTDGKFLRKEVYKDSSLETYSEFFYKPDGRLSTEVIKGKNSTAYGYYFYDEGRLSQKSEVSKSKTIKTFYNQDGTICEKMYYEKLNNKEYLYQTDYYNNGKLYKTDNFKVSFGKFKETPVSQSFYDEFGNEIKVINYSDEVKIRYTLYKYNRNNKLINEEAYFGNDMLNYVITYDYTEKGSITTKDYYSPEGEIYCTEIIDENRSKTNVRPYDSIENRVSLTAEEIAKVNKHSDDLGCVNQLFDTPQNINVEYFLKGTKPVGILSNDNLAEVTRLEKEGLAINFDYIYAENDKYYIYDRQTAYEQLENYLGLKEDFVDLKTKLYSEVSDTIYVFKSSAGNIGYIPTPYDAQPFVCIGGEKNDKYVKLFSENRTLVAEKQGDNYIFVACYEEKHIEEPVISDTPKEETIRVIKDKFLETVPGKSYAYNAAIKAYNEKLDEIIPDKYSDDGSCWKSYALYDINNNGIPELFLSETYYTSIYTYDNGKVIGLPVYFGNGQHGPTVILKSGMVIDRHYSTGVWYTVSIINRDNTVTKVDFGHCIEGGPHDYYANGEWVTREEYLAVADKYLEAYEGEVAKIDWQTVFKTIPKYTVPALEKINDAALIVSDTLGVYRYDKGKYVTVSAIDYYKQLLTPENLKNYGENITDLSVDINNQWIKEDFKNIFAKEVYDEQSTGYDKLYTLHIVGKYAGELNPIVSKIKYTDYTLSEEKPKDSWIEGFEKELAWYFNERYKASTNSPIVIKESWSFTHDGKQVDIVTACNMVCKIPGVDTIKPYRSAEECDIPIVIPAGENFAGYEITLLFIDNKPVYTFSADVNKIEDFGFRAYETMLWNEYDSYQYDYQGNIVLCPMFTKGSYNLTELRVQNDYLYLDVDGDGMGEIIEYNATWANYKRSFENITVYKIINGLPAIYTYGVKTNTNN